VGRRRVPHRPAGAIPASGAGTSSNRRVGDGQIKTQLGAFAIAGEGLRVGRDGGSPVVGDDPGERPWPFTGGTIRTVAIDVSGEPYVDLEREPPAMLARE
jgi:hypothetical protein